MAKSKHKKKQDKTVNSAVDPRSPTIWVFEQHTVSAWFGELVQRRPSNFLLSEDYGFLFNAPDQASSAYSTCNIVVKDHDLVLVVQGDDFKTMRKPEFLAHVAGIVKQFAQQEQK
ncbi:hypothetical protein RCMENCHIE_120 [Rhodobacter phage RcMenchie]|nr:hypothetical protein RCMENCHIE_120 [Rhodobacter phage RcMenchie]